MSAPSIDFKAMPVAMVKAADYTPQLIDHAVRQLWPANGCWSNPLC